MVSHLGRSPLSRQIIWTDLVFRVRRNEELSKDQTKVMETSQPRPSREKRQLERRTRKLKPQEGTDHARSELDGLKVDTEEPPSIPGKVATEEKQVVKRILVDLRPLLENIMDSCNHGQEELCEDDAQKDGRPSSNPGELPGEKATEGGQPTRWTTLCLTDSGLQRDILPPTSEEPSMERTTLSPEKGILFPSRTEGPSMERRTLSLQKDIVLPPQTDGQPTGRTTLSDGGPHDDVVLPPKSERGEHIGRAPFSVMGGDHHQDILVTTNMEFSGASAMHLKGPISPRGVPLELGMGPRLQTEPRNPISFPKITPSEQSLPEADGETNQPEAFSFPDIELPMQLLLRRLGETTTSQNHLLIAHVMRYLREGLLPDGSSLFEWNHLPELPNKTRKAGRRLKEENSAPANTKKSGAKFVWKCNRSTKLKSTPDLRKYCQTEIKEPRRPREKAEIASFEGRPDASRKIPDRTQRVPTISCPSSVVFRTPR